MNIEIIIHDKRLLQEGMFPQYAKPGDAGMDVRACIDEHWYFVNSGLTEADFFDLSQDSLECVNIFPGEQTLIPLGFSLNINNPDVMMMLVPRSGFGSKGLVLGNTMGIIDSGYQGQVMACAWNRGNEVITIKPMERIAQMIFVPIIRPSFKVVEEFSTISERGGGGFGSSGAN